MVIKLLAAVTGVTFAPEIYTLTQTATDVKELRTLFKVEPGRSYLIAIEFAADMYNMHGEEDQCVYYDLAISVNSLQGLADTLSCSQNEIVRDMPNLVDELPTVINDSDLDFSL